MPIHIALLALLIGPGQAKRLGPPPRVFPVAKVLGKSPAAAKPFYEASFSKKYESRAWDPFRGGPKFPLPEPDSLADMSGAHGSGNFSNLFAEGAPISAINAEFEDGRVAYIEVSKQESVTWQRHLQMAGLSPVGVRVKSLAPKLFVLEGVRGLPAGTRVTREMDRRGTGSKLQFRLPPKRPVRVQFSR